MAGLAALPASRGQAAAAAAATLAATQARGVLSCGVVTEAADWTREDRHGDLSALGEAVCRALAVATLGRPGALTLAAYPAEAEALGGLASGEVDVVVGLTPSATAALRHAVTFGPPVFWDSQTFLVHRSLGIHGAAGLAGRTVCYIEGTDQAATLLAAMKARRIAIRPFPFQEEGEMLAGLVGGHCGAVAAYASQLAALRARSLPMAHDLVVLPDRLAVAPATVATRAGDAVWTAIVAATVDTLVEADMLGITAATLAAHRDDPDPSVRHLLGGDWSAGLSLGLRHDWSARVIAAEGNYGEVLDRTVGEGSPLGLKRDLNATCLRGGVLCAEDVR